METMLPTEEIDLEAKRKLVKDFLAEPWYEDFLVAMGEKDILEEDLDLVTQQCEKLKTEWGAAEEAARISEFDKESYRKGCERAEDELDKLRKELDATKASSATLCVTIPDLTEARCVLEVGTRKQCEISATSYHQGHIRFHATIFHSPLVHVKGHGDTLLEAVNEARKEYAKVLEAVTRAEKQATVPSTTP